MVAKKLNESVVRPHQGRMLMLAAGRYPNLLDVILEQVQNAIDSNAKNVYVIFDQKRRRWVVQDDGDGASVEKFNQALGQVGFTMKSRNKLGQFGLGLVSPLGKCVRFTFTSCPKDSGQGYMRWTFVTCDIEKAHHEIMIPREGLQDLRFADRVADKSKGNSQVVNWRTQVAISNFTKDKLIGRINGIDEIVQKVFDRFGVAMHKHGVRLHVRFVDQAGVASEKGNLKPPRYTGEAMEPYTYDDKEGGRTTFYLYLARNERGRGFKASGPRGKVAMGEADNDFRFPFANFAKQASGRVPADALKALESGLFEGEILSTRALLDSSRKGFVENDAFMGLCNAIEEWFEAVGLEKVLAVEELRDDERYQRLARQSLDVIAHLLNKPELSALKELIGTFKTGTVGDKHSPPDPGAVIGQQPEKSLSTDTTDLHKKGGKSRQKSPATADRKSHMPFTAVGPKGQNRKVVKNDSLGLQFCHEIMPGNDRLWEIDGEAGIIYFNTRHPIWEACDKSERRILQLQQTIAIVALQWLMVPSEWQASMRQVFDDYIESQASLFKESPAFNPGMKITKI